MIAKTSHPSHRLVIVGREHDAPFEELQRLFADSQSIEVIRDRRRAERRRAERRTGRAARSAVRWLERRRADRRIGERRSRDVETHVKARGWWVVPRAAS